MICSAARKIHFSYISVQKFFTAPIARGVFENFNFAMGFVGAHNLMSDFNDFRYYRAKDFNRPLFCWKENALRIVDFLGNLSMVLYGIKSAPFVSLWNWSAKIVVPPAQLERCFGSQGIMPGNTFYASLSWSAFILGIPSTLKTLYSIYILAKYLKSNWREKGSKALKEHNIQTMQTHLRIRREDVYLTARAIKQTTQSFILTPHK